MKLPIRIRLALTYCAVFFVLIGALEAAAYWSVGAAIHSIVDHELETRVAGLDDHIGRHLERYGWPKLGASLREHPAFQPDFLLIRRANGEIVFDSTWSKDVAISPVSANPRLETFDGSGHALRVLTVQKRFHGELYDVICATDLWIPTTMLRRLWLWMLLSLPAVLLVASGAGYWISGRALRPVSGIIAAAKSIDSTNLSERIAVPSTGDEIQDLAETMNGMLARIEDGFRQVHQFTANASHELRTPVAIIRAGAEVALLKPGAEERTYREALHRILRQAERNSKLLEEMLQLARADSGLEKIRRTRMDIVRNAALACSEMAPLAEAKGVRLSFQPEATSVFADADEDQIRRLWLILLDNAVKYTPAGGAVTLRVFTMEGVSCGEIADSGIGISEDHLSKIFERFYRVDKARSRGEGGAGLGLSIANEIARLHGARIEVSSKVGVGSCFRVLFAAQSENINPKPSTRSGAVTIA
jgi:heavy metal sensor kinase